MSEYQWRLDEALRAMTLYGSRVIRPGQVISLADDELRFVSVKREEHCFYCGSVWAAPRCRGCGSPLKK